MTELINAKLVFGWTSLLGTWPCPLMIRQPGLPENSSNCWLSTCVRSLKSEDFQGVAGILVVLEAPGLRPMRNEGILMKKSVGAASLLLGTLLLVSGCNGDKRTTCYGTEPDGDRETLKPCPPGWGNGESRNIGEDQFWSYEVGIKDKPVVPKKAPATTKASPKPTIPKYTPAPAKPRK